MLSIAECAARMTASGARLEMEILEIKGRKLRVWKNVSAEACWLMLAPKVTAVVSAGVNVGV